MKMGKKFYIEKTRYHENEKLRQFHELTANIFKKNGEKLNEVKRLAHEVLDFLNAVDPFIQNHTEAVCPYCEKVCCINKHSYYEHEDIIYIYALAEKIPFYKKRIDNSDHCQFLGANGCTIRRSLRPYRCNWFFCTPLLERMQSNSAVHYRKFIRLLEKITSKRENMLNAFIKVIQKNKSKNNMSNF
jgi:hypothetical protein